MPRSETSNAQRPGKESFLDEYGLPLAFLAATAAGIYLSLQVVGLAVGESRMGAEERARARACVSRAVESLDTLPPGHLASLLPAGEDRLPLERRWMVRHVRAGEFPKMLFCPGQGPLRRPDSVHYELRRSGERYADLHCQEHGRVYPPPEGFSPEPEERISD